MELTILMPCLNEAETIESCIVKARQFLVKNQIDGEVLISDNGSTDGSVEIATSAGARVVHAPKRGYGGALIAGCDAAKGKYVIMGDSDDSYDFLHLMSFLEKLRAGYDLVMGNRFAGGIEKGAMPWSHRYIGNPILSFIGRLFFKSEIRDFHCGLRGFNRESIAALHLKTTGMEYASELVVMAELNHLKITEVPATLSKDGRSHAPHLNTFSDGWRHLKFLFMYSPNWLFLYPGGILTVIGLIGEITLSIGKIRVGSGGMSLGIHTMLYCMLFLIIGSSIIFLFIYTKLYAAKSGFIPSDETTEHLAKFSVDKGIVIGFLLFIVGIALTIAALVIWGDAGYDNLIPENMMRLTIPAITAVFLGIQFISSSFFIGILQIPVNVSASLPSESSSSLPQSKEEILR